MNSVVRAVSIEAEVTASDFRNAMRQLTGGVSVITAGKGRDISGMTVTSVSSLSVDPPSLIVSLNRESSSWPLVKRYGFFGPPCPAQALVSWWSPWNGEAKQADCSRRSAVNPTSIALTASTARSNVADYGLLFTLGAGFCSWA